MRDPLQSEIWAERFDLLRSSKGAVLVALILLFLFAGLTFWLVRVSSQPAKIIGAEVLRFGSYADYDGNHPLVIVRLPNGQTRQVSASGQILRNCRKGGKIPLIQRSADYRVAPRGCARET